MVRTKKKFHTTPVRIIIFIVFLIYAVTLLIPYLWGFLISLKTRAEYLNNSVFSLPGSLNFSNYSRAWTDLSSNDIGMVEMLLNSFWFAVGTSVFEIFFSAMAAYVVAKYKFPGRSVVYFFALITLMIPLMGTMPSNLRFLQMLGAYNSPLYMIVAPTVIGGNFLILYSSFKNVSWEYAEAAIMDGASHLRIWFQIMLPQVISVLVALFLTSFIVFWSDSMSPLIYFPDLPTLASGLYLYQTIAQREMNYPIFFAGLIMSMIPTVVLFFIFQESMMDIQLGGGLKG